MKPLIRSQMPELDSVRGLAVTGVLVVHAFVWSYGYEGYHGWLYWFLRATALGTRGVELFFVLSGFLITGILLKARQGQRYYQTFYWKRICRILPPYFLTILLVLLVTREWKFALISSLFMANISEMFGVTNAYGPLWSLAVEEHFYLIWPTVVRLNSVGVIAGVAALIVVFCPALRGLEIIHNWPLRQATWFHSDALAMGSLVRLAVERWPDRKTWRTASPSLMMAGLAGLAFLVKEHALARKTFLGNTFEITFWGLIFTGLLSGMLLLGSGRLQRYSNPAPLALLGYVSYGAYLYHVLVYQAFDHFFPHCNMFLRFAIVFPVTITLAWLSRISYEEYFLRKKGGNPGEQLAKVPENVGEAATAAMKAGSLG